MIKLPEFLSLKIAHVFLKRKKNIALCPVCVFIRKTFPIFLTLQKRMSVLFIN